MRREYAKERAAHAARHAAFLAAHKEWVALVDKLPQDLQQAELEWNMGRIKAAEMWGSLSDPSVYTQRIIMLKGAWNG